MTKNEAIEKAAELLNRAAEASSAEMMDTLARIADRWINVSIQLAE